MGLLEAVRVGGAVGLCLEVSCFPLGHQPPLFSAEGSPVPSEESALLPPPLGACQLPVWGGLGLHSGQGGPGDGEAGTGPGAAARPPSPACGRSPALFHAQPGATFPPPPLAWVLTPMAFWLTEGPLHLCFPTAQPWGSWSTLTRAQLTAMGPAPALHPQSWHPICPSLCPGSTSESLATCQAVPAGGAGPAACRG